MTDYINKITVQGHIAKDAKAFEKIVKFSVCTIDYRKQPHYHSCLAFNKHMETAAEIKSGMTVKVEGAMAYGKYTKDGVDKYTADIICQVIEIVDRGHAKAEQKQGTTPDKYNTGETEDSDILPF